VQRWPASFPQYVVGHLGRVARIETLVADLGPLALAGAWARGIGIPACVAGAENAATAIRGALAR
jgi:oxygen-dependent protoporphyrinogen oxidase